MKAGDLIVFLPCPSLFGPGKFKGCTATGKVLVQWLDEYGDPERAQCCDPHQVELYDVWIEQGGSLITEEDLRGLAA